MFYNVENMFDIYDDPETDDGEFLPGGTRRWTFSRYTSKRNSIYKVIMAAGGWEPPAMIGLCEVENRKVAEDLVYATNLSGYEFGIIHEDSHDPRGIDVCMLYRKDLVKLLFYKYLIPDDYEADLFRTRSVLYSKWLINSDTLHMFLNHWPSRRGGVLSGESLRLSLAKMLLANADSLSLSGFKDAKILIAGDFNCTTDDGEILALTRPEGHQNGYVQFINLADSYERAGSGTYRYMGVWEMLDQVLVSKSLLEAGKGLVARKTDFRVFDPAFLLKKDPRYPGLTPFSTYYGFTYQGGYSDHLPVILDLFWF